MLRDVFYFGQKPNVHPRERQVKDLPEAKQLSTTEHFWIINEYCDYADFDWDWDFDFLPDEEVWISNFINAWPSETSEDSKTWLCPKNGTDTILYRTEQQPLRLIKDYRWKILDTVDLNAFDFNWKPDPYEPPYIYTWGSKYISGEVQPALEYHVDNATERKYMPEPVKLLPQAERWNILIPIDESFDFSWRPHPNDPPMIYVFGHRWIDVTIDPAIEYVVPGAIYKKYTDIIVELKPDWDKWNILVPVDKNSFDFSWRPSPHDPPFIYVFGNKWNEAATEPTLEYVVPGATDKKYINELVATPTIDMSMWEVSNSDDLKTFDFSWRPNPFSPPQIYQWENNGPRYITSNATDVVLMEYTDSNRIQAVKKYTITTTLEDLINEHIDEVFWALNSDLNYDKFDFTWRPNNENFRHINVFGTEQSKDIKTYYVNGPIYAMGYRDYNYITIEDIDVETKLAMFYVDRGNSLSNQRYNELLKVYPELQKTRYLNSWVDTIQRCGNKSKTKLFWVLNSEIDYSDFKFDFYPTPWQMKMVHVFGTQWSHWGNTYLINSESFAKATEHVKIIEHLNILNFVKTKRTRAVECLYNLVLIDHGNAHNIAETIGIRTAKQVTVVPYSFSYLETLKNIIKQLPTQKEHYVWVCSSICDYSNFDFTYICDPYTKEQLHVFPSNLQKFGDTFLIDVNKLRESIETLEKLEDFDKVNYNQHLRTRRLPAPIISIPTDTHCDMIDIEFDFPYAIFQTEDINTSDEEPMNMWEPETKTITVLSEGATKVVVPKQAKNYIKRELYDYPYIKKLDKLKQSKPIDIVFISNGETIAEENYNHLLNIASKYNNRVVRVDGINGRVASQCAAANASNTPWYFLVNAKLRVNEKFNFNWQPDRLQIPKHYIFTATNRVNHLEYGHQAIVANNKKLTLNTVATGLDFTLDSEHEVISINSGIGMYNTSKWDTWRTAFRETLKLKYHVSQTDDLETKYRLSAWQHIGEGDYGDISIQAATEAIVYFQTVNGDFEKLKLSYDWDWLRNYYETITNK